MTGELFDSYGRPVIIPVALDDSSGLFDNYGRPLQVVNALPLTGGHITGEKGGRGGCFGACGRHISSPGTRL
jgi:hypothetical protein